jgi:hypothetical protein
VKSLIEGPYTISLLPFRSFAVQLAPLGNNFLFAGQFENYLKDQLKESAMRNRLWGKEHLTFVHLANSMMDSLNPKKNNEANLDNNNA